MPFYAKNQEICRTFSKKIEEKPDVNVPHWLSEQDDQKA